MIACLTCARDEIHLGNDLSFRKVEGASSSLLFEDTSHIATYGENNCNSLQGVVETIDKCLWLSHILYMILRVTFQLTLKLVLSEIRT